jgi:uncharacterized protein YdaU (DUF1376 family)
MAKSPAFQFYAENFLIGTALMTKEEVGTFVYMLCYQWTHGSLPSDQKGLRQLLNVRRDVPIKVLSKFRVCEDGNLRNDRLEQERAKQAKFAESRRANAKHRWSTSNACADASASEVQCTRNALQSSSSDCSQNAINKDARGRPRTLAEVVDYGRTPQCGVAPAACEAFWNHYESVGWTVQGIPISDWKARLRGWKTQQPKVQIIRNQPRQQGEPPDSLEDAK